MDYTAYQQQQSGTGLWDGSDSSTYGGILGLVAVFVMVILVIKKKLGCLDKVVEFFMRKR